MTDHNSDQRSSAIPTCEWCGTTREDRHLPSCLGDRATKMGLSVEDLAGAVPKNTTRRAAGLAPAPSEDLFEKVHSAVYVDPGDTLVVAVDAGWSREMSEDLEAVFLGLDVRVIVLEGVSTLACIRRPKVAEQSPTPPSAEASVLTLQRAEIVANAWHQSAIRRGEVWSGHAFAMVRAALAGATEPADVGLTEGSEDWRRFVDVSPSSPASRKYIGDPQT